MTTTDSGEVGATTPMGARSMRDPITFEVVRSGFAALADQMAITVVRTAHSQILRDSMDFSTAVCDAEGRVLAQGLGIPLHLGAIPDAMATLLARYPGDIHSGDIFIFNDPDEGGMHLPDVFIIKPVFEQERMVGYVACVAHYADIGGRVPGGGATDSREIFEEGLQIPMLKLYERGRRNEALAAVLLRNVRVPEVVAGDLSAQLAACHTGEAALRKLVRRYGADVIEDVGSELLDYAERLVRMELARIPPGTYAFEDHIDNDGAGGGPVRIATTVTVEPDRLHVDFTGTSPQVASAINATPAFAKSAVYTALMAILGDGLPGNDGFSRAVTVHVPEGTIANPRRPAARAARGLTGFRMVDAVLGALAQAAPSRVPAAGDGGATMITIGGRRESGESFVCVDLVSGGWGARDGADGCDGVSPLAANLANVPVEELELHQPVRVLQYGFVPDTGGAGRWRGALSVVRELQFVGDAATLQLRSDRRRFLPYGLEGGLPGTPSDTVLNPGPDERTLETNVTCPIRHGDVIRHVTAGGGGYGPLAARAPEDVLRDVLDGKLTSDHAERTYGVSASGS